MYHILFSSFIAFSVLSWSSRPSCKKRIGFEVNLCNVNESCNFSYSHSLVISFFFLRCKVWKLQKNSKTQKVAETKELICTYEFSWLSFHYLNNMLLCLIMTNLGLTKTRFKKKQVQLVWQVRFFEKETKTEQWTLGPVTGEGRVTLVG